MHMNPWQRGQRKNHSQSVCKRSQTWRQIVVWQVCLDRAAGSNLCYVFHNTLVIFEELLLQTKWLVLRERFSSKNPYWVWWLQIRKYGPKLALVFPAYLQVSSTDALPPKKVSTHRIHSNQQLNVGVLMQVDKKSLWDFTIWNTFFNLSLVSSTGYLLCTLKAETNRKWLSL